MDGDLVNLDVTLYHGGYHGDLNETYYVGDRAKADPDTVRVIETARACLDAAIKMVKPGALFRDFGNTIEKIAKERNCTVIRTYVGHGINTVFHAPPNIPHYAKNKAVGECKPGMTFTIEPMIALGKYRDVTWPDNWTSTTIDGKRTAQFGKSPHALLFRVVFSVADNMHRTYPACHRDRGGGPHSQEARVTRWPNTMANKGEGGTGGRNGEGRSCRGKGIRGLWVFVDIQSMLLMLLTVARHDIHENKKGWGEKPKGVKAWQSCSSFH